MISTPLKRWFFLLGAGAVTALAHPPVSAWAVLFISLFPLCLLAVKAESTATAFRCGMAFGLPYFTGLLYWLAPTIHTFGALPWPVAAACVVVFATYLSFFPAGFAAIVYKFRNHRASLILIIPCAWTGLEWLRGWLFTGFPWGLLGHGLVENHLLIQVADLGGAYLLSFGIALANAAFTLFFITKKKWPVAVSLVFWLLVSGYGHFRIQTIENQMAASFQPDVAILQGNLSPVQKWDPAFQITTIGYYERLIEQAPGADLYVWPETATPFYLFAEPVPSRLVAKIIRQSHAPHLIGSPAFQKNRESAPLFFNTSYLTRPDGTPAARYDKRHLVPFGEYIPLMKWLPFLGKIITPAGFFTAGTRPPVLFGPDIAVAPLICFESVFPLLAGNAVQAGANLLAVQTNDAWFGNTAGPYQHFAFSVFRAVECRRTVVRSANTGISAVILPTGAVAAKTDLGTRTSLHHPAPLLTEKTLYVRSRDSFASLCLIVVVLAGCYFAFFPRRSRPQKTE